MARTGRSRRPRVVAVVSVLLALGPAGLARAESSPHLVQRGETLSGIALLYGVTVEALRGWNSIEGDAIRAGQQLLVGEEVELAARADPPSPSIAETVDEAAGPAAPVAGAEQEADRQPEGQTAGGAADPPDLAAAPVGGPSRREGQAPAPPTGARPTGEPSDRAAGPASSVHVVAAGETLSGIAAELGVTVGQLVSWNPGLEPDRLGVGQRLVFRGPFRVSHAVRPGESLTRIARRYGVTTGELLRWNRELRPDRLRVGQRVSIQRERPPSESIGHAARGRLVHGVQLGSHPGYVLRNPDRSWATEETVAHVTAGFDAVRAAHPDAPRVRVHDLSLPGGGRMDDHRSHQSGRDVDVIYFQRRCPARVCPFRAVAPAELDLERQWTLFEHWLRSGVVEMIFVDASLQRALYEHARQRGASPSELSRWFQYPRGARDPGGIVRHAPNHRDHAHVRFVCPEGDELCE